jgi:hypothetical protein
MQTKELSFDQSKAPMGQAICSHGYTEGFQSLLSPLKPLFSFILI